MTIYASYVLYVTILNPCNFNVVGNRAHDKAVQGTMHRYGSCVVSLPVKSYVY